MKKTPKQTPPVRDGKADHSPLPGPTKPTPLDIPLPAPMELAKLAAMIGPKKRPYMALPLAMGLYLESWCFLRECPTSPAELLSFFAPKARMDRELVRLANSSWPQILNNRLELDTSKDSDPARDYLSGKGLRLKTTRAVLANVERVLKLIIDESALCSRPLGANFPQSVEAFRAKQKGEVTYNIPCYLLNVAAKTARENRSAAEPKQKGWQTRRDASKTKSPKNTGV